MTEERVIRHATDALIESLGIMGELPLRIVQRGHNPCRLFPERSVLSGIRCPVQCASLIATSGLGHVLGRSQRNGS